MGLRERMSEPEGKKLIINRQDMLKLRHTDPVLFAYILCSIYNAHGEWKKKVKEEGFLWS
jgi:hypothetical protein